MLGFVDYGGLLSVPKNKESIEAKTALFFMLVEVTGSKSIPLGYILTNGLTANTIASIINQCLKKTAELGGTIINITFDGLPANFTAAEKLGANLDITSQDFRTHFMHPVTGKKVFVMLDSSHMFKLARNAWKDLRIFIDKNGNV